MLVDTNRENLNINKLICKKKEMIFVEEDMIVPDSKPDILSTISTSGNICIYKKELMEEKIKIDGNVNAHVMYLADNAEDNVRGINVSLDFSKTIDAPSSRTGMLLDTNINISTIECNVINGRKINVKVGIEVKFKIYSNEEVSLINGITNNNDIQVLEENLKVNSLVGSGNTKAYVKDTIMIENTDNLAEILRVNINMVDRDIKTSYNKVLAKTEAEVRIMYLTEDNRICTVVNKIPIVGFIDIPNVSEENICDTNYEIRNMVIKPNNIEEHSIYIELEVEVLCMAYEEKEINLIQDLYSPFEEISCNQKEIETIANKENRRETCHIKENVNVAELTEGNLIDVNVKPMIIKESKLTTRIMYEGELTLDFIFSSTTMNINTKTIRLPFEYTIDNIESAERLSINTQLEVQKQDFIIQTGGDVSCNIDIMFNINMYKNVSLNVIDNLEILENRDLEDYSLIIYIVKQGDYLWKIAKRFRSTVDDIVRANAIENPNVIMPGQKLYIPKYVRRGARKIEEAPVIMNYA